MTGNRSLAGQTEKRMDRRIGCKARINWSYFNENRFFDAKVFNYSRNGVYLETQDRIRPNTTILIRLEALHTENKRVSDNECIRTVSLGEVKWCHELSKDDSNLYGVGVRYCRLK
jgi:hypothetical protein